MSINCQNDKSFETYVLQFPM